MWKLIPVLAAITTLGACSAPPTVKYPSASAARVPVNAVAASAPNPSILTPVATGPSGSVAIPAGPAGMERRAVQGTAASRAKAVPPPAPIPVGMFFVNAKEQTALAVMRRWARAAKVDFTWESALDYPLNDSMRAISTSDLAAAVELMRKALEGGSEPLAITLDGDGLAVRLAERPAPAEEMASESPAAPPLDTAPVAAATTAGVPPGAAESSAAAGAPAAAAAPASTSPAAPPPVAAASGAPVGTAWSIGTAQSLREVISKWAAASNVALRWESSRDFPLTDEARGTAYSGDLRQALGQLAGQFGELAVPLSMRFTDRGAVLRVFDAPAS